MVVSQKGVVIASHHPPLLYLPMEHSTLLHRERVGRKVVDGEATEMGKIVEPLVGSLVGQTVDEVDTQPLKSRCSHILNGFQCLTRVVATVEQPKVGVVERLYTQADTVEERELPQVGEIGRSKVFGVGLEGHFGDGGGVVTVTDSADNLCQLRNRQ